MGPPNHKTITHHHYLFLFVSYDSRHFNKAAGGENKTPPGTADYLHDT